MTAISLIFHSQAQTLESSRCSANTLKKEPQELSPDIVRALLEVSPERQQLDDLVDKRCYALHADTKSYAFSALFEEIIDANKELFSSTKTTEKANILYHFHSDAILQPIISEKLTTIVESFLQKLHAPYETSKTKDIVISESIRALYSRIDYLHSGYVRLAVADALKVPSEEIPSLSYKGTLEAPQLKKPSGMDIYRQCL